MRIVLLIVVTAVNRLIENGSSCYSVKVNGKWEKIPWAEIKEWIEKQYGIEPTGAEGGDKE